MAEKKENEMKENQYINEEELEDLFVIAEPKKEAPQKKEKILEKKQETQPEKKPEKPLTKKAVSSSIPPKKDSWKKPNRQDSPKPLPKKPVLKPPVFEVEEKDILREPGEKIQDIAPVYPSTQMKEKVQEEEFDDFERIVLESYEVTSEDVTITVDVIRDPEEFVKIYHLTLPEYGAGTRALLDDLKSSVLSDSTVKAEKMADPKFIQAVKDRIRNRAEALLAKELPDLTEKNKDILVGSLLQDMLGLGQLEYLLNDPNLEEIVINSASEPVWVYHKRFGWLKTNVSIAREEIISNYSAIIARRVKKQINILNPLLDAHLITGDRANATLFPISSSGNTLTVRKFRRDPWTVVDFIRNNTVNSEVMALVWHCFEYELNVIISGGTAAGKTSFLNVCMPFIQPNQRIISIEDTREIQLPKFLHWVPLTTRAPSSEGKGGISMLDLLVNSLRMRPDRIIVGEMRRQKEAEVLFEGMHTGHSAYTTVHANTSLETIRRIINPPISVPKNLLGAVHLNVVMFRNRRLGVRKVLQVSEFILEKRGEDTEIVPNILYRWNPTTDSVMKRTEPTRLYDELSLHTGTSLKQIKEELAQKKMVLDWMVSKNIRSIGAVGRTIAEYYKNKQRIMGMAKQGKTPAWSED